MEYWKQRLWQAAGCLLCTAFACKYDLVGTEFGAGRITGPLAEMQSYGVLLFLLALILTFFLRRIAAVVTLVAGLLCLPLYLFFVVPGLFRLVFGGLWRNPFSPLIVWDWWSLGAIAAVVFAACTSLWPLFARTAARDQGAGGGGESDLR